MASYGTYLGKGIREPVSPYREYYIFGAELNPPDASYWNAAPRIVEAATSFDLSTITENHEVCIALLNISNASGGAYTITFRFYRERDNKLLFDYSFTYDTQPGGWMYAFAYIGWTSWEINEDGAYRVEFQVSGAGSYTRTIPFTITGIAEEEPPEPPPPSTISDVIQRFVDISTFFYSLYLEALGWITPFNVVADFFYSISVVSNNLAWDFYYFNQWVNNVTDLIANIHSWEDLKNLIISWLPNLPSALNWFLNWTIWVGSEITLWWSDKQTTVRGWIDTATQGLSTLEVEWNNFWNYTLPNLLTFSWLTSWWTTKLTDIRDLVNSTLLEYAPFWEGWQDVKEDVILFFSDPLQWLYDRMEDFFERFW